jgi:hypothetical protein
MSMWRRSKTPRSSKECRKSTTRKGHKGREDRAETGFLSSVFVIFVAFPYCDVLKVGDSRWG